MEELDLLGIEGEILWHPYPRGNNPSMLQLEQLDALYRIDTNKANSTARNAEKSYSY